MPRRILEGVVVSNKSDKTVVVFVEKKVKHSLYGKYINSSKKYSAHDPQNRFDLGDIIKIVETRPISKTKTWEVIYDEVA